MAVFSGEHGKYRFDVGYCMGDRNQLNWDLRVYEGEEFRGRARGTIHNMKHSAEFWHPAVEAAVIDAIDGGIGLDPVED